MARKTRTPEEARQLLHGAAINAGIPHADRFAIRRDTDRGRTWAVVVLNSGGGHLPFGPEFTTWPACDAYVSGLLDGFRAQGYMVERSEYIVGEKSGRLF